MDINQERQLLERIRKRDKTATERFYDLYAPMLMSICRRYIPDTDDAKDVLQDSLIKILDRIGSFRQYRPGGLEAWMIRITVNQAISWLRKRKRLSFLPLQGDIDSEDEPEPDYDSIDQKAILEAICSLPDGYRTVLNLYVFEDKSHREIADLLGITEGTSASQLHRARALLWKKLNAKEL